MLDRNVTTVIDTKKCNGCELCIKVCPSETISMQEGKAKVTGDRSLQCGHCVAVCPVDAVRVGAIDAQSLSFNSFDLANDWLPHGAFDTARLVQLMASRRSCRNYTDRTVERSKLEDLVKIGTTQGQRKLFFRLKKEKQKLQDMGFEPNPELISKRLGV